MCFRNKMNLLLKELQTASYSFRKRVSFSFRQKNEAGMAQLGFSTVITQICCLLRKCAVCSFLLYFAFFSFFLLSFFSLLCSSWSTRFALLCSAPHGSFALLFSSLLLMEHSLCSAKSLCSLFVKFARGSEACVSCEAFKSSGHPEGIPAFSEGA